MATDYGRYILILINMHIQYIHRNAEKLKSKWCNFFCND